MITRVHALKRLVGIGLAVRGAILHGDSWASISLLAMEAWSRAQPLHIHPTVLCLRGMDVYCKRERDLTKCELQQSLPTIIQCLMCPATAEAAQDAINSYSPERRLPVRLHGNRRYLTYPLLPNGDCDTTIFFMVDQAPEAHQCTSARRGCVTMLTTCQSVRVHGYDFTDFHFDCQFRLTVRYTTGTSVGRSVRCSLVTYMAKQIGDIHLVLTGDTPYYGLQLTW